MLFSSMVFIWLFLPAVFCLYHFVQDEYRNYLLLAASIFFYAWGEPVYIFLMLFSIAVNYFLGICMDQSQNKKLYFILGMAFDLALLGYFKYFYTFWGWAANHIIGREDITVKAVALPLGISFYTFQIMSYMIDLYWGKIEVQKNIWDLALYISFFPQLIAGPIVKYKDIETQITSRTCTCEMTASGIQRFIYGLGKKVIVSNTLAAVADSIFQNPLEQIGTKWVWIGVGLYTLQIYYDFSGYSDMAIGLGRMFGFRFMENFRYPYISCSVQEFWRRWHISLSTWFKEYVYIPLGGNRKGTFRTYINLWIVFIVTGIWHGATLNFLLWGVWHGFFIFIERVGLGKLLGKNKYKILNHIYVMLVAAIGWGIFRCDSLTEAVHILKEMFCVTKASSGITWYNIASVRDVVIIVIAILAAGPLQCLLSEWKEKQQDKAGFVLMEFVAQAAILGAAVIMLVSGQYNPFIYFKF